MKYSNIKSPPKVKININGTEVTLSFSEQPDALTKNNILNILLCAYDGKIDNVSHKKDKITQNEI